MGNGIAEGQSANEMPPEDGKIIAITLDATSHEKDLWQLNIGGQTGEKGGEMFLTLMADVKFWFKFASVTGKTCDQTSADAAAATPITFQANACIEVPTNLVGFRLRIDRKRHRFLVVKGSGAGTLRMWVSSDSSSR